MLAENKLKHKQHFIQAILKVKIILKKMVLKTVQYFSQCTNIIEGNTNISEWKSKGLSNEVFKPPDNRLAPELIYSGEGLYVKFNGSCLKEDKITFNHSKIVNIYIFYALKSLFNYDEDCFFGALN